MAKLQELQNALKLELEKEEPNMKEIKRLRGQIIMLGMQITPIDIYKNR